MPAAGTPLPWDRGNGPCVMAPPHLRGWAEEAAAFLSRRGMDGITAFATSGSSGSPPKAILFTRRALDICARGALEHLHAEIGDWCCPLPLWHVGGAMIYLRAALAGTAVHTLRGKWCPQAYADLMRSSGARWSSLVPTQVVDLVRLGLRAPSTAGCIIVGGGALDAETGRKARTLGWPIVQSYGMTEAGSQLATAFPGDSFHTDRLSLLPHWEVQTDKGGLLRFQGEGKLSGRLLTQTHGGFLLERVAPQEWWGTRDLVRLEGRLLTFLRRADRLVKVLGELVDPDAVQDARQAPGRNGAVANHISARRNGTGRLRSFRFPSGASLPRVECVGPRPPAHPRRHGNAHPPHGHGKAGPKPAALPVERSSGKVEGNLLKGNLPGIFIKRIRT